MDNTGSSFLLQGEPDTKPAVDSSYDLALPAQYDWVTAQELTHLSCGDGNRDGTYQAHENEEDPENHEL